jgi:hypothetical protein
MSRLNHMMLNSATSSAPARLLGGNANQSRRLHLGDARLAALLILLVAFLLPAPLSAQGIDTALLRGTVTDPSGAVMPNVTVTLTNSGTGVVDKMVTDPMGRYLFNTLRPASYTARVEGAGFKTLVQPGIVLRVGQQSDLDFVLQVGSATESIEVTAAPPLLNTVSGSLGTEVTNRYIVEMPLMDRSVVSLAYLAPGVTELTGGKISGLGGTNFVSNGQRNGTAEFRLDGAVSSTPEGGEGGNTTLQYKPSVEAIQEFKLQNNSFSAEYGNNGGTVVSMITKSGTNQFHGSGWYFGRRPGLDANDFFSNSGGQPKGEYAHDQYGGSLGGPVIKQRTFFFFDYERTRDNAPFTTNTTVPTALQKNGDFSQTYNADGSLQQVYDPLSVTQDANGNYIRSAFAGNVIPATRQDAIAKNAIKLYPAPTGSGDPVTGLNNYTEKMVSDTIGYQTDIRIDHNISDRSRLTARYSRLHNTSTTPNSFLSANTGRSTAQEFSLAHTWTPSPTLVWDNRASFHRGYYPSGVELTVDPLSVGFPSSLILNSWYGKAAFPAITVDGYQGLNTDSCCTTSSEADTQYVFHSTLTKVTGSHNMRFGGEARIFLNNFFQPSNTSGGFAFDPTTTMQDVYNPDYNQGNSLASFLTGWGTSGGLGMVPAVANRSGETAFFFQDDWRVTNRLTVNLGLRYEWSTPYSERFDRNQFSCFSCASGITVPTLGKWAGGELYGTTIFASSGQRHANSDRNNLGPRVGLAYRLDSKTVLRGGAGVYYGLNFATNWQYGGTAWNGSASTYFSKDDGLTQYASMENPFPAGLAFPQQTTYGALAKWGFSNGNHDSLNFSNGEIYQWNFGIQRELPGGLMVEVNYSASRSTHLPWNSGTGNLNRLSVEDRTGYTKAQLSSQVPNPFQYLFTQVAGKPAPIFNEPTSLYNDATIRLVDVLRPYPQFRGTFSGFSTFNATARYNSMQVRFEKRATHDLSLTGSYSYSRFTSNSDAGANPWTGNLYVGSPQDYFNLAAEQSVSANDTPHRLVVAAVYDLPFGRGKRLGNNMNRVLDGFVGGWKVSTFLTLQTGQPIYINDSNGGVYDGNQRPNISGDVCSGASIDDVVSGTANYFNVSAFSHPGYGVAGNAPRYNSSCRVPGVHNLDLGIGKRFQISERKFVEFRAEAFNALNTPRFSSPDTTFGTSSFGVISSQANSPRHGQLGVRFEF